MWNNPNDPMPIKTTNMAGLQKWEETEDYTIYLCKDATMTTVQRYVAGTFQEFQERKALIDSSQELMRSYTIAWTDQDSINLINEINDVALTKLEQSVMMLPVDSEEFVNKIPVLLPRAVPVTYECCFRVDKKNGEIYIGEGYENLSSTNIINWDTQPSTGVGLHNGTYKSADNYIFSMVYTKKENIIQDSRCMLNFENKWVGKNVSDELFQYVFTNGYTGAIRLWTQKCDISAKNIQITKTSTPKPFVKSVMPSGKLAFVTDATSETHSFVMKRCLLYRTYSNTGAYVNKRYPVIQGVYGAGNFGDYFEFAYSEGSSIYSSEVDYLLSKNYAKDSMSGNGVIGFGGVSKNHLNLAYRIGTYTGSSGTDSFAQLLIYKANLTETELKGELAKDIRLK